MGFSSIKFPAEHDSRQSGGVHLYDMSCPAETVLQQDDGFHTRQQSTLEDFIA